MKHLLTLLIASMVLTGCVSQKKYAELQAENDRLSAMAPATDAKAKLEASEVKKHMDQIQQLRIQVETLEQNEKQFRMMMESGEMPQPTSEQMRMYELQHMEELQKSAGPGNDPMMNERSEFQNQFEQGEFQNRLVVEALKATLAEYNQNQVSYDFGGGRSVICINNAELFEAGKAELSEMGKGLVARLAVALQGNTPLFYHINAVTNADMNQAADRAGAVYAQLAKEKGNVRMPLTFGSSACENAAGVTKMPCDRIEISLEQNYELIMGQVREVIR